MRRIRLTFIVFLLVFTAIILRLFYWQVLSYDKLTLAGSQQYIQKTQLPAMRGEIKSKDGFTIVSNQTAYTVTGIKKDIKGSLDSFADQIAPFFTQPQPDAEATLSGLLLPPTDKEVRETIYNKLNIPDASWIPLFTKIPEEIKGKIEQGKIAGLKFDPVQKRFYPEASISAHLLGFVGSDYNAQDKGYFGLEGYYDRELKGSWGMISEEKDVYGRPIIIGDKSEKKAEDGRDLILNIDRTVQYMVEDKLRGGLKKYGAKAGSVVIMDPKTGDIMAMSSFPAYDPNSWFMYDSKLYKNPVVADAYEPGSTFKVLVMAGALNEGAVTPETKCDKCSGPREISGYNIRTWNNKYFPNTTMTDVLVHSDNTGMVFVQDRLGKEKFLKYLDNFGVGQLSGIDLEEETSPALRDKADWRQIDLATASFGQGIVITPISMIRAVAAIANGGNLMEPHVVEKVITSNGVVMEIKPKIIRRVISLKAAKTLTEMMIQAVDRGEAKWAKPKGYRIAGKTGTAQIPVAGHYDESRTIASFVGFAPADDPKFVMLVRLTEPTSSPWGSETAAPLFFDISRELFSYYGIGPQ